MRRFRFSLSIEHLWPLTTLAGIFAFVNTHPIRPHDFWWHIAAGRDFLSSGRIPTLDTYSYTATGQPYPAYKIYWLMETLLYQLYTWGGAALVVFAQSLLITGAYLVLLWLGWRITHNWRVAALGVLFAAALGMNDWNVRPQAVTFLIGALYLLAIDGYQSSQKIGWMTVFPAGMLIWVNSHGTFPIGLGLVGLWLLDEGWQGLRRRYAGEKWEFKRLAAPLLALGLAAVAALVNPQGAEIIAYVKSMWGSNVIQSLVVEWAAPGMDTLGGTIFLAGLLLSALVMMCSPQRPTFYQAAAFLAFGWLGLKSMRGSVWFGIVMAPILSAHLAAIGSRFNRNAGEAGKQNGLKAANWSLAAILMLGAVISLPWFKAYLPMPPAKAGLISGETPVTATEVLISQDLPPRVFNALSFGSYLIWAAQPRYQVFVDPRIDLYPADTWREYLEISNAMGDWESKLVSLGVQTLMLSPAEQPTLVEAVSHSENWELIYQDDAARLYRRRPAP